MTKRLTIILAAVLLVTGLAAAQGNGKRGPMGLGVQAAGQLGPQGGAAALTPAERIAKRVEMLTKVLDLTPSQVTAVTSIFTKEAADMEALRPQFDTPRDQLQAAVQANSASGIDAAAAQIGTLHGKQVAIQAKARAEFLKVLTADQIAKLGAIRDHFGKP
jgi:Spy/CpxP family protein refolding chaperone